MEFEDHSDGNNFDASDEPGLNDSVAEIGQNAEVEPLDPLDDAPFGSLDPEGDMEEETTEPVEPSRMKRWLRAALRWTVTAAVVFALGVLVTWVVRVQPEMERNDALGNSLANSRERVEALEEKLAAQNDLVENNQILQSEVNQLEQHLELLRVFVDVTTAQSALVNDDSVTAKASLAGTSDRLTFLMNFADESELETLDGMQRRLLLVLEELDDNVFAAESDLEVLHSNLVALERSLFD
jgi:hypothetical protein